jgi:ribonuclease HII
MKDKSYIENLQIEQNLYRQGFNHIVGVDEVGRGCFAGPVVCAAVIMKKDIRIPYLTDSKLLPKSKHMEMLIEVKKHMIDWHIVAVPAGTIDEMNILRATLKGMKDAVNGLTLPADYVLVDGNQKIDIELPQQTIIKGDYYSHTISAASLLAKTYRDELMKDFDEQFGNVYQWAKNAGYPTSKHVELVREYGLTPFHRRSWKKVMDRL